MTKRPLCGAETTDEDSFLENLGKLKYCWYRYCGDQFTKK